MRHSDQRDIVYQVVSSSCDHPIVDTILTRAKELMPSINMATVYRNLNVLLENKTIKKIKVLTGSDKYDYIDKEHYHVICNKCGKVSDIEEIETTQMLKNAEKKIGGKITSHSLTFFGICKNCAEEKI